jgi:hypothetical protein
MTGILKLADREGVGTSVRMLGLGCVSVAYTMSYPYPLNYSTISRSAACHR